MSISAPNILILSASAGAGHVRAAEALERALGSLDHSAKVTHVDTLQHTNTLFRNVYSKAYLNMVNTMPEVLGWLYDQLDKPDKKPTQKLAFDKLNTGPFIKLLERYQPDVTICTHSLPAEIIAWMKQKERLETKLAVTITDFDVHALWLCEPCDHYFVAFDETRAHLEELGIEPARISTTGIPIDPAFARPKDRRAMRLKYGLAPDRDTILLSAGGFGVGKVEVVLEAILKIRHPAQVVVICGKNEELRSKFEQQVVLRGSKENPRVHIVGYTTAMDEYMAAADLIVGKPGGLTSSEALARGLVFVVVNPIPGQEERNSDHLLEEGAAVRCNNLPVLAYKIDQLLGNPARFHSMRANAIRLARPHAAQEIAMKLLELADRQSKPRGSAPATGRTILGRPRSGLPASAAES
jgi:processive 1,2-diacylglycerol beta-glucosyltransferase